MIPTPLLSVEDLTITIAGSPVVDGVTFGLQAGEILAVVGESGCGKSLTALALMRLLPPAVRLARGHIRLEGKDLATLPERAMCRVRGDRISIIFQEPTASLDPLATVGSQIAETVSVHRSIGRAEAYGQARDMLVAVGIPDPDKRMRQYPFELSGGMCQRVMIATALICSPALLIADEPTTALDVTIQAQILDLIKDLVARRGTSVLLITHDMGVVAETADRVAVMYGGRIAETASTEIILRDPRHPYTALLLNSIPRADHDHKGALASIEGTVPAPADLGPGCRFAPRCPLASVRCADAPPLAEWAPGHRTACWHADQVASLQGVAG